ncbi:MAG: hypothetical protein II970_00885 [Paludibacteraceae bacterium]|nr:hypothetical protein [Paludibacteraceae bacterium]
MNTKRTNLFSSAARTAGCRFGLRLRAFSTGALRAVVLLAALQAVLMPLQAQSFTYKDEQGLYYLCDGSTLEATLIASRNAADNNVYKQSTLHIPATVIVSGSSLGSGGGSESETAYAVTEIGEGALKDAWVQILTFDADSRVRVIRREGMYNIRCTGTLTLPASLKVIEELGLYRKSKESSSSFISTVVLPAGLDSLGKSAIVLNKLQTLQFLGTTPPKCHYTESSNPWAGTDAATPDNITVTYPEGSYTAYNNRKGIGTYFTSFTGPDEMPTGIDRYAGILPAGEDGARKIVCNGQVLILRDGRFYTAMGQLVIDN